MDQSNYIKRMLELDVTKIEQLDKMNVEYKAKPVKVTFLLDLCFYYQEPYFFIIAVIWLLIRFAKQLKIPEKLIYGSTQYLNEMKTKINQLIQEGKDSRKLQIDSGSWLPTSQPQKPGTRNKSTETDLCEESTTDFYKILKLYKSGDVFGKAKVGCLLSIIVFYDFVLIFL